MLTSKQRSNLRGIAAKIEPIGQVGKNGISENMVKSFSDALDARELIKLTVLESSEKSAKETGAELAAALKAEFVAATGRKVVLYRRSARDIEHVEF